VIFDIVGYIVMEWTMPNESRICSICRRVLTIKKRRVLLASLPQSSIGQKRISGLLYITRMREYVVEWSGASFQRSPLPFVFKIPSIALNMTLTSHIIIGYFTNIIRAPAGCPDTRHCRYATYT
jgi:hypothetical protein